MLGACGGILETLSPALPWASRHCRVLFYVGFAIGRFALWRFALCMLCMYALCALRFAGICALHSRLCRYVCDALHHVGFASVITLCVLRFAYVVLCDVHVCDRFAICGAWDASVSIM